MRVVVVVTLLALLVVSPTVALAHGDLVLADEVFELVPGGSVAFHGDVHYHRLVGGVSADGPVRVRLVDATNGAEVLTVGPASGLAFNELVLGASRRPRTVPLRRPMVGLTVLAALVVGLGSYAIIRYGVGGAPSVVAGNADLPVIPMNRVVSRASLLLGVSMLGWGLVGLWWVRAGTAAASRAWQALGLALVGTVLVVAVGILTAYGGPLVQTAWFVVAAGPILAVLLLRRSPLPTVPTEN